MRTSSTLSTLRKALLAGLMIAAGPLAAENAYADGLLEILLGHSQPHRVPVPAPAPRIALQNGQTVRGLSGAVGARHYFELQVQPGTSRLVLRMTGGLGDSDLYLSRGALPDPKGYEHSSTGTTTAEAIAVDRPAPGTWYALAYGYRPFHGVDLVATWGGPPNHGGWGERGLRAIRILQPAAAGVLTAGQASWIRWTTAGGVQRVHVLQSFDGGATWTAVTPRGGIDAATGRLAWTAPLVTGRRPAASVHLRVVDVERTDVADTAGPLVIRRTAGQPGPGGHPIPGGGRPIHSPDPFEPNDESSRARRIEANTVQAHAIGREDDEDWLMFVPPAPGTYRITFSDATMELEVRLYSARAGSSKEYKSRTFEVGRRGYAFDIDATPNARYFKLQVQADDDDDTGTYRVAIQRVTPVPPGRHPRP
ncbi:MAG TPA: PPC domain-containing protein [Phycisphaerae bacterium]|nr:PPC domain-containing protein [Phycisphaerae bacterium]